MDIEELRSKIDRAWGYRVVEELRVENLKKMTHEEWVDDLPCVHYVREPTGYLFQVAADLQKELDERGITFCFIGGVPLQRWGEIRHTNDVDLTIFCELGDEPDLYTELRSFLVSRVEKPEEVYQLGRMYPARSESGKQIDISIGFTPYERRMMERAVDVDFGVDVPLRCCSAEDLVITKTIAGRGQDWVDLGRIIQRTGMKMDWDLVWAELEPLLKMTHEEERLPRLKKMVDEEYPPQDDSQGTGPTE